MSGSDRLTPALISLGPVSMSGSVSVINPSVTPTSQNLRGSTIVAAGPVVLNNGATTKVSGDDSPPLVTISSPYQMRIDILMNAPLDATTLFGTLFGRSKQEIHALSEYRPANELNGVSGKMIRCSSLNLAGIAVLGSPGNPIVLVIDGPAALSENVTIYGFLYVAGSLSMSGNTRIVGAAAVEGATNVNGVSTIQYDKALLATAKGLLP